ncbi:nif11-like leader peptide domain protein [Synechococcus sp. BIOS-E4-1]|uniref:Nif11-like leader peptide family natural product precursor n=1 Tax=Synechococcus sp. BIOS-E4-1 TaxID=1400864 RepID=UPI0016448355|nr:Nif11-like leader peptide family natural product precursor [Synechococcus sp. BIOS-E4-1]QNI54561.1 nif11-like leader peptide domain protein [Synechococcus sp. BIOS-E4-1]
MSEEQLKAFLTKVKGDSNLQEKLKAANSLEDVVSIGKEYGHEFTSEKISQLSEEELEEVVGGNKSHYY